MDETCRPSWDAYFMSIARQVATRSSCLRRQVGALLVRDRWILATGYNGAPRGITHCAEVGCLREKMGVPSGERHELCRGVHAEMNAFIQAAVHGTAVEGADIYSTCTPCSLCTKIIANAGVTRVVVDDEYPSDLARDILDEAGIEVVRIEDDA